MKYLRIFIIILLIPFIVLAEECDVSNITITSMKPNKIEGNTEVISDPTFEDRTINLDLKMYEVGDSISYDMTIKNDSEEDYMIDEDTFKTDSDYIEYTLKTKDNTNVVKANSTKEVSLIVTYKKEIEDDKLTNNKFNASNSLKLSLNTSEKEQPLDIITTDNIKESLDPKEVKNPVTSVSSMLLISLILLTTIVIVYILIKRKNRYTKYLLIILSMILIPTVYAICKCDIEVESTIEIEKLPKLYDTIVGLSNEQNACVTKYDGEVTDEVGKTVPASNVYFNNCENQRNVIFGGFCWQVIRTTETGGVKMIYNGEPVNGKCEKNRSNHKGIIGSIESNLNLNNNYLYGSSFTYDVTNNTFSLVDTEFFTLSDLNYENLIGHYTCKNTSGICTTLYHIGSYTSGIGAAGAIYQINDIGYAQVGTSPFNAGMATPAMVGYMFNISYNFNIKVLANTEFKYSDTFVYDNNTNTYTLSGTTKTITNWSSEYNTIENAHYTCWNTTGKCTTLSYIYNIDRYNNYNAFYIELKNGKNIRDALNEMLTIDDVNKYNSSAKGIIDAWFKHNLLNKMNSLDDAVYCNDRSVIDYGGWNENQIILGSSHIMSFKNSDRITSLSCSNITDQFAVSNNKAKLAYPVALLEQEELYNMNYSTLLGVNSFYWLLSPADFQIADTCLRTMTFDNTTSNYPASASFGIRPVVSLIYKSYISSGTGSENNPWIIE